MMSRKILIITTHFPPNNTGAAVVMGNLINGLKDEDICGVVTCANSLCDKSEKINDHKIYKIFNFQYLLPARLRFFSRRILLFFVKHKVIRIIKKNNIKCVVGVYPDLDFLDLSFQVTKRAKIKFYPYLHDLPEGVAHKKFYGAIYKRIQDNVFKSSTKIFVMSEGMKDLIYRKFKIESVPLVHSYSESIFDNRDVISNKSIFWGGSIYSINKESVKRVHEYCKSNNLTLTLSAANEIEKLKNLGFENRELKILPYLSREEYIVTLAKQKLLLLSIDWPDESDVSEDELSTIFPTKTIEYLLSGRPIIVHCPRKYFLARFFEENQCGLVLSSRNQNEINLKIDNLLNNKQLLETYVKNGYEAVKLFHIESVTKTFYSVLG